MKEQFLKAKQEILSRRTSVTDFKRGWNDCWAFISLFDDAMRNGNGTLKTAKLDLSRHRTLAYKVRELGFNSLQEALLSLKYEEVTTPENGCIGFHRPYAFSVYYDGYWWSPIEQGTTFSKRKAVKKYIIDPVGDIIGTTKALVTGIDTSGIGIQNLVAMIAHPRSAIKALPISSTNVNLSPLLTSSIVSLIRERIVPM